MSVPSSTSSSDPRATARRLVRALAWCALALFVCRAGLALWKPTWMGRHQPVYAGLWLRSAEARELRVLALGSSRMHAAFDAEEWERLAELPRGGAANAAFLGVVFWEELDQLRRAGGLPRRVELVLIEVPRWNFNWNRLNPVNARDTYPPARLREAGTLADLLAVDEAPMRMTLLAEVVWPLYQRRPLWRWIQLLAERRELEPALPDPPGHWDPELVHKARRFPGFQPKQVSRAHFHDAQMSEFAMRNLRALIDEVRAAGARVGLVRIPIRAQYLAEAAREPQGAAFLREADRFVESLAGDGVVLAQCRLPKDCGLRAELFTDYGHMNREGARAFTRWLVEQLGS